ncbi:MAG TPA: S8 family serine peptidase, partial [Anaerolineae bacterium]|nr:S8 family serine peptidase [Anaerolineae bacterium]
DLSSLDLSQSLNDLLFADFDTQTKWPPAAKMPAKFDWQRMMEWGKNPGLGIRKLHVQGITGKGVGLAIIDQPLIVDHHEYAKHMQLYEEINIDPTIEGQMHGSAVASIAVGKTVGVAPEADLYYIGAWTGDWGPGPDDFIWNFRYYAQAVRHVLHINQQLPEGHKIRVIAMQVGWSSDQAGYADIMAAVKEAREAGLLVVSSSFEETFGFSFHGLGRAPLADPNKFESYEPGIWWAKDFYAHPGWFANRLLVPMDSRTTASPGGAEEYVFYREGGWSWSIPYIAGMYALAAQVKPAITPDEFWALALKTGRTIELQHNGKTIPFGSILDPVALIKSLQTK